MSCFNHSGACDKECETKGCLTLISCTMSFCPACTDSYERECRKIKFFEDQVAENTEENIYTEKAIEIACRESQAWKTNWFAVEEESPAERRLICEAIREYGEKAAREVNAI